MKNNKVFYNIIFNPRDDGENCFGFSYNQMRKLVNKVFYRKTLTVVKCCEIERKLVLTGKGKLKK